MTLSDTIGLGFMTFALFLGAGNLIFPPLIGMLSGEHMIAAMMGFLITAVGLPLLTLLAIAKVNGEMTSLLPKHIAIALMSVVYIIIGPAFAAPRTGLVAYEIGAVPFLPELTENTLLYFTSAYFLICLIFSLFPTTLVNTVGKLLTPCLIALLIMVAYSVFTYEGTIVGVALGDYQEAPFITGFLEGYNTMDALGALMFGMLIINILKRKGITQAQAQYKYLMIASIFAATGLACVYGSLFVLGGVANNMLSHADNGSVILTTYVNTVFGEDGLMILSVVVTLACLTTSIGLISSCASYFNEVFPNVSYRMMVLLITSCCLFVSNVGLSELISLSIPVLYTIYPVIIVLVALTFLRERFAYPEVTYKLALAVALFYGLCDGLKQVGVNLSFVQLLSDLSLGWFIPSVILIAVFLVIGKSSSLEQNSQNSS